ncbi:MAG: DUF6346 domain-containing protein, partial [Stackebrandtia sp.]
MSQSRRGPGTIMLVLLGVVALLAGWTAMNLRGGVADEKDLDDRVQATGVVQECIKDGPFSLSGVGYWWSCEVEITTDDGETARQTFTGSQFEPADQGAEFPLASKGRQSSSWSRADVPAHN